MPPRLSSFNLSLLISAVIIFVFLWLINFFNIAYPISVTNKNVSSELAVSGIGQVDVVPDTAQVSAGISVNDARNVDDAKQKIDTINNKIIDAVLAQGIAKEDITTSNYSINPSYLIEPGRTPSLYSGNATITVKVKDTDKVGSVITAATEAGATNVYNAGFSVDDPSKFQEQARNEAIEDAKSQAQKLAGKLGIRLGKITNIVEMSGGDPVPPMYKEALDSRAGTTNPVIEPGSQKITSSVTLYFERR